MTTQSSSATRKTMLTHLTVAGTAALAGTAASAQVTVVPVNETIGLGSGDTRLFVSSLPGSSQFVILTARHTFTTSSGYVNKSDRVVIGNGAGKWSVALSVAGYADTPAGKKFSTIIQSGMSHTAGRSDARSAAALLRSTVAGIYGILSGNFPTYLSFRFAPTVGGPFDYGWIELGGDNFHFGSLSVTIDEYAYDVSGYQLPNGQTSSSVPEPSPALALAAFSALTLGAAGVRRLKAINPPS